MPSQSRLIWVTPSRPARLSIYTPLRNCLPILPISPSALCLPEERCHDLSRHSCQCLSTRTSAAGTPGQRTHLRYLCPGTAAVLRVRRSEVEDPTFRTDPRADRCAPGTGIPGASGDRTA